MKPTWQQSYRAVISGDFTVTYFEGRGVYIRCPSKNFKDDRVKLPLGLLMQIASDMKRDLDLRWEDVMDAQDSLTYNSSPSSHSDSSQSSSE